MSKAVVYTLLATATIIFFKFLSPLKHEEQKGSFNRRFGYKILERAPTFDPIVTKIEREVEQIKQQQKIEFHNNKVVIPGVDLGSTTSVYNVAETYQFLTSGGKLNTTLRLMILFPLLDRETKDGFIVFNELESWIAQRSLERLDYSTQTELESKDEDGDLSLSFREYLPHLTENDIEKNEMTHGEAGWWRERFDIADSDHNGLLNFTELRDFLHPEDSKNPEMLKWMIRDRFKRIDDQEIKGKLNFNEFEDHVYSTYENYMDFETNGVDVPKANDKFAELDVNKDQFITPEELLPILPYLYPGELAYAKYYTCYLMNEADDNEDKQLTLEEMLNHEFIFYNTVYADGHEESDDDHDEL
ncbi:unnamed protein product [Vicia faba]|uniref:EF-hand domain-containing protein n=1 Tax=Vicia faba TaxID=3906 RepID=A0AAV1ABK2_VICFA|nr:unnamed protein product [Vicia faba]